MIIIWVPLPGQAEVKDTVMQYTGNNLGNAEYFKDHRQRHRTRSPRPYAHSLAVLPKAMHKWLLGPVGDGWIGYLET